MSHKTLQTLKTEFIDIIVNLPSSVCDLLFLVIFTTLHVTLLFHRCWNCLQKVLKCFIKMLSTASLIYRIFQMYNEVTCASATNLQHLQESDYNNTLKASFAITPPGAISFISKWWGCNISDINITRESGFIDHEKVRDGIMADMGFLIRNLLLEKRGNLIMYILLKKCSWGNGGRLNHHEIVKTKTIAHLRIYVKRAIRILNNLHILANTPLNSPPLANSSLKVCWYVPFTRFIRKK